MPDHNTPPSELASSDLGRIVRNVDGVENTYQITAVDYTYLAYASHFEETHYPWLAQWAISQRFCAFAALWPAGAGAVGSLKRCIELFCAPMNPVYAYEGTPGPSRAGRRPPVGPRCPITDEPIPGRADQTVWNRIMRGAANNPHANDGVNAQRRARFESIRKSLGMRGTAAASQEWTRGGRVGPSEMARRSAWAMCRAQMGNPIPGFDNWAAYRPDVHRNALILPEMSAADRERTISNAAALGRERYWIFGAGRESGNSVRYSGYTNRYHYRTFFRRGSMKIIWDSTNRTYDSDRAPVEYGHYGEGQTVREVNTAGGRIAAATPEGLAPTTERPASNGNSQNGSRNGRVTVGVTRVPSALEPEADMFERMNTWADEMETILTRELGVGVIRR